MKRLKTFTLIKISIILMLIMVNIGCDQVSKSIVRERISSDESIGFIGNHFTLTKVENAGAFLSLGDHIPVKVKFVLLTLIPLLALIGGTIYLAKNNVPKIPLIAACFAIGGGIGNIYDRLLYGSVTDFMHIGFGIFQTGIFNMADVSVTVGVSILFIWYWMKERENKHVAKAEA